MCTMKAVAKSGVIRFKIGTEASPAMISPHRNTVSRLAFLQRLGIGGRQVAHGGELEIFAPEQIAVAEIERDQVDAGNEQQEQRDDVDQQHDEEEFQRQPDRLQRRQLAAGRIRWDNSCARPCAAMSSR